MNFTPIEQLAILAGVSLRTVYRDVKAGVKTVKEYIEWLYMLLYCPPDTHLEFARYTKPIVACEAQFYETNTGVKVEKV